MTVVISPNLIGSLGATLERYPSTRSSNPHKLSKGINITPDLETKKPRHTGLQTWQNQDLNTGAGPGSLFKGNIGITLGP